jgi:hypothetical protein
VPEANISVMAVIPVAFRISVPPASNNLCLSR